MYTELKNDSLYQDVKSSALTIVQYSATWCGNCRIIKPKFKKLSEEFNQYNFVVVDAEKFPTSRHMAKVQSLPHFAVFKDGNLLSQSSTSKIEGVKQLIHENSGH